MEAREGAKALSAVAARMAATIAERGLAERGAPVVLMVSGGSDSTALAYAAAELAAAGLFGPLRVLHVNHLLRGADADADARFVEALAGALGLSVDARSADVGALAAREGGNVEAVGRRVRYEAAADALAALCREAALPVSDGRIFTAHTVDDRIESFYMRSIVGTGPGGFRAMRYRNGAIARPLLDASRAELRAAIEARAEAGLPVARDAAGALWREDATNAHTDRFRAFVRHEIVPLAEERNPRLRETLARSMNLVADEDDFMAGLAFEAEREHASWEPACFGGGNGAGSGSFSGVGAGAPGGELPGEACVLAPAFGACPLPVRRRVVARALARLLGPDARIEAASIEAVLAAFGADGRPQGGYVANVQGNIAVSANKRGVRIEPMAAFRRRRKKEGTA